MRKRNYISCALFLLLAAACSKTNYDEKVMDYGGISFYNASFSLDFFISNGNGREVLLPMTGREGEPASLTGRGVPTFSAVAGFGRDYPGINWHNSAPWVVFDHYSAGSYSSKVALKSRESVSDNGFSFIVNLPKDKQVTFCISDSLGRFSETSITHIPGAIAGTVKLRLVQLCPDADSVNLRLGNQIQTGMQNLPYRSVSEYLNYPLVANNTLKLRIFNGSDTLATIARADLVAVPGQSYLLILRNYSKAHQYTDSDGHTIDITANAELDIRRIN